MATSYFSYGAYNHPQGQVNLSRFDIRPNYSPRGKQTHLTYIMHLQGEIQAVGQSAVITEINNLISAYSTNDLKAVLKTNAGTDSPHVLDPTNPNALSPVRVINRSWPQGGPEELANIRTFSITLAQDVIASESGIIEYHDSVEYMGTGGPAYRVLQYPTGAPKITQVQQYSVQRIIQSGWAVGDAGYVAHWGPMFAAIDAIELTDQRRYKLYTPNYYGKASLGYKSSWQYVFMSASDKSSTPPILL